MKTRQTIIKYVDALYFDDTHEMMTVEKRTVEMMTVEMNYLVH